MVFICFLVMYKYWQDHESASDQKTALSLGR